MRYIAINSLIVLLSISCADADGGFFFVRSGIGHSADQQAILVFHPDTQRQTLVLATGQDWDDPAVTADYAWVVPVPSPMRQQDFTLLPDGRIAFGDLADLTEPRGRVWTSGCGSGMCAAPTQSGDSDEPIGVTRLASFQVDRYEIHILSATESNDLQSWLEERGYAFSAGSVPILQHYIDRGWYFTAVRVTVPDIDSAPSGKSSTTSETSTATSTSNSDLLQLTFTTSEPIFPLRISAASTRPGAATEILLYLFAPYRVESSNFATFSMQPIGRDEYSSIAQFRRLYRERFDQLRDRADGRAFVVEYAAPYVPNLLYLKPILPDSAYVLTRMRAVLTPEQMDEDLLFARAVDDTPLELNATTSPVDSRRIVHLLALSIPFALGGLLTRRRQLWLQTYLFTLLILVL